MGIWRPALEAKQSQVYAYQTDVAFTARAPGWDDTQKFRRAKT